MKTADIEVGAEYGTGRYEQRVFERIRVVEIEKGRRRDAGYGLTETSRIIKVASVTYPKHRLSWVRPHDIAMPWAEAVLVNETALAERRTEQALEEKREAALIAAENELSAALGGRGIEAKVSCTFPSLTSLDIRITKENAERLVCILTNWEEDKSAQQIPDLLDAGYKPGARTQEIHNGDAAAVAEMKCRDCGGGMRYDPWYSEAISSYVVRAVCVNVECGKVEEI